jgi:DNA recombination protein RmuC
MYIPAENVYYECVVKSDEDGSPAEYALSKKVIPVSPGSFYAYLQVLLMGLRGFQIQENAQVLQRNLARLTGDLTRFTEDFDVLGRHVLNAQTKFGEADRRLRRLQDKLGSAAEERALTAEEPEGEGAGADSTSPIGPLRMLTELGGAAPSVETRPPPSPPSEGGGRSALA